MGGRVERGTELAGRLGQQHELAAAAPDLPGHPDRRHGRLRLRRPDTGCRPGRPHAARFRQPRPRRPVRRLGVPRRGPGGRAVGGRRLPHGVHLPIPGTSRRSSGRDHRDGRHDPLYGWTVEVAMSDGWGLGPLELWGGVECTVNRLGDTYRDQLVLTGHDRRVEDLDRFAALGIRTLRYPVLWERTAPNGVAGADWRWPDARLTRARELGLRPIVGLVHHGSGPSDTSLLDEAFPERLAEYARAVAERYPWVTHYPPVNEPLTTARFSGIYGIWYPHRRDDRAFVQMVLNQCRASILAMRAIREVVPEARWVQTEDLGRTYSTPLLAYQADFDNDRRWLSLDLLTGRLAPDDRMWRYLRDHGIAESTLAWFVANGQAPDVIGINHYVTSNRYLDSALHGYPEESWGGNGRHQYADVAAVRAVGDAVGRPRLLGEGGTGGWKAAGDPRTGRVRCGTGTEPRSPSRKPTSAALAKSSSGGCSRSGVGPSARARAVPMSEPSQSGRCWARTTGTHSLPSRPGTTSRGRSTCAGPIPDPPPSRRW